MDAETIDVADVKVKKVKGAEAFLSAVTGALSTIVANVKDQYGPDQIFSVDYQGDFGEVLADRIAKAGGSFQGVTRGTLGAV